ncbi:MAG: cache domain-containing protein, partial [Fervidobacterium sp.]
MLKIKSIFTKFLLINIISLIAVTILLSVVTGIIVSEAIKEQDIQRIKSLTEVAYKQVEAVYEKEKAGEITRQEAEELARQTIGKWRYEGENYIFIINEGYIGIVHPTLAGKYSGDIKDARGTYVVRELVEGAKKNGETILEYFWEDPNTKKTELKIGYGKWFEPYGWMIGTGVYLPEIKTAIGEVRFGISINSFGFIVLVFTITFFIIRKYQKMTNNIIEAVEKISQGDFTVKLNNDRKDEFGRISDTINAMVQKTKEIIKSINLSSNSVE